jgi:hypothetical protein
MLRWRCGRFRPPPNQFNVDGTEIGGQLPPSGPNPNRSLNLLTIHILSLTSGPWRIPVVPY